MCPSPPAFSSATCHNLMDGPRTCFHLSEFDVAQPRFHDDSSPSWGGSRFCFISFKILQELSPQGPPSFRFSVGYCFGTGYDLSANALVARRGRERHRRFTRASTPGAEGRRTCCTPTSSACRGLPCPTTASSRHGWGFAFLFQSLRILQEPSSRLPSVFPSVAASAGVAV